MCNLNYQRSMNRGNILTLRRIAPAQRAEGLLGMRERPVNLPSTGIASFCKAPIVEDFDNLSADVAVLGIPWDESTGFRPGSRLGPREIRQYSVRFPLQKGIGFWDVDFGRRFLADVNLVDTGDVDIVYTDLSRTFDLITDSVSAILDRGAMPVLLGGDHSVAFPIVRALSRYKPLSVVHIDAHLDYTDSIHGVRYSNSSPFKRISELEFVGQIAQIGMRGLRGSEPAFSDSNSRGNTLVMASEVRERGVDAVLERIPDLGPTYVSIDIDALDPSVAPGTGSPEPDGLAHWQLKKLLRGIAARARGQVVGFDLVEVNPLIDTSGLTALVATTTILGFLGAIFEQRGR
jgi:agmatinase